MSAKHQHQVINPPNTLRAKVPKTGGPGLDKMTADAAAALREINGNYEVLVRDDLRRIDDAISRAERSPLAASKEMDVIAFISHDIKGQAATLGYPLLTAIAQSLCRFIEGDKSPAPKRLGFVSAHARAMGTVVAHTIRGDSGEAGKILLGALVAAGQKAISQNYQHGSSGPPRLDRV